MRGAQVVAPRRAAQPKALEARLRRVRARAEPLPARPSRTRDAERTPVQAPPAAAGEAPPAPGAGAASGEQGVA